MINSEIKIKRSRRWTKEDVKILEQYYSILPIDSLIILLERNKLSIYIKAYRLKLKGYIKPIWSQEELDTLVSNYPMWSGHLSRRLYELLPNKTKRQISLQVKRMKLKQDASLRYVGKKFNLLTVIKRAVGPNTKDLYLECKCECGNTKIVSSCNLRRNHVKSCGCFAKIVGINSHNEKSVRWKGYKDISGNTFYKIKSYAEKRDLEFNLTIEYLYDLLVEQDFKCVLTNLPIGFAKTWKENRNDKKTASLDRIDSGKGYIKGNVQWVYKIVNQMKWDYDQDYFISLCKKVDSVRKNGVSEFDRRMTYGFRVRQNNSDESRKYGEISAAMFNNIRCGARNRKLEFNITREQILDLYIKQKAKCALTGWLIQFFYKSKVYYASLDRIDSSRGYNIDNVQWVHRDINKIKRNLSNDDFFIIVN